MPKGVPWSRDEEKQLVKLREYNKTVAEIAAVMGKSEQAVMKKLQRLGLKVVHLEKSYGTTTSELVMPEELPSVEEVLKIFAAALKALETPDLSKTEVMRLRSVIQAASAYQTKFAEYVDYRGIERELASLREKYEEIVKRDKLKKETGPP